MDLSRCSSEYEFCPKCEANLTLQKGYSNSLPFWSCRGCGEMLINPAVDTEDDIVWICDGCGEMLNTQSGFMEFYERLDHEILHDEWQCTACGFANKINPKEIYLSEDEYLDNQKNPYKGMSDNDVLELLIFDEIEQINGHEDVLLVRNTQDGKAYVKKILSQYETDVYKYIMEHPISNIPRIYGVYESDNYLIIIEEYISGRTLKDIIDDGPIKLPDAINIARKVCYILKELHGLGKPIIHRDIKPSNIIVSDTEEVYLIDLNVAKWYSDEAMEDTKLMGTIYYAAPEQFGYGFSASSSKSDIYAMGMLLNVMITGKMPKKEKAQGAVWNVIEKCIALDPKDRYTDDELLEALDRISR